MLGPVHPAAATFGLVDVFNIVIIHVAPLLFLLGGRVGEARLETNQFPCTFYFLISHACWFRYALPNHAGLLDQRLA
jgi:hypothetical protein